MPRQIRRSGRPKLIPIVSIVVPVLNEADNVLPLVARVKKTLVRRRVEIIFVDDSRDTRTVKAVKQAKTKNRSSRFNIHIYHRTGDKLWGGLSGAVADGFRRAKSNQIIVMDGDLQHPPETIPAMLKAARNSDVVVASRYCQGGSASGLKNGVRHLISYASTLLAKSFFPIRLRPVSDPMTGFFLINRTAVDTTRLRPKGFKILLEILATHPKLSIGEVPLQFAERVAGNSNGGLRQGWEFLGQLLSLRAYYLIRLVGNWPKMIRFGAIGGSVFAVGMVLLYVLVEKFGWSPLQANAVQLAITFWLNYALNKRITWSERTVSSTAAHKFFVSRAATTVLNYYLFAWLISLQLSVTLFGQTLALSIHYLVANVITLAAIMALNFVISDRWAFAEQGQAKGATAKRELPFGTLTFLGLATALFAVAINFNAVLACSLALAIVGVIMLVQASIEVWRMLYAFREPEAVDRLAFPSPLKSRQRFCLIVPARHESLVLADTLQKLAEQTHPSVEIIAVMCDDDYDTLRVAEKAARQNPRISVMQYPLAPGVKPSKPKQLNYVLNQITDRKFTVIGVIDAEDTVHPELLRHVDTAFANKEIGIVQGGVQLINHDSTWYSLHNVLEYYRWFNSAMSFQADNKFMPLGGNTVFIRYKLLKAAGGWPDTLTEDCSLGVLLSTRFQAKTAVYYEPKLATLEETPETLGVLFRQRVRWNQGFFHEWRKGVWHELPLFRQRLLAGYVLLGPVLLASMSLVILFALLGAVFLNAPVGLVMIMYLPLIPITLQLILNAVFLRDFGKAFQRRIRPVDYAQLFLTYFVYQFVLNAAAFWSVIRELRGEMSWDKTPHSGQHRLEPMYVTGRVEDIADATTPESDYEKSI